MSDKNVADQAWAEYDAAAAATDITCAALEKAEEEDKSARRRFYRAERAVLAIGPRHPAEPPNCLAELRHSGELGDRRHS